MLEVRILVGDFSEGYGVGAEILRFVFGQTVHRRNLIFFSVQPKIPAKNLKHI